MSGRRGLSVSGSPLHVGKEVCDMLDTKILSLLKVVETRSYTQASRALNLTQPAISQHVRALEEELGVRIFERIDKKLTLTREGEIVVRYAKLMISVDRNLKKDLEAGRSGITILNIGITHTMESNGIAEVLAKFASQSSSIQIKLITDTLDNLVEKIRTMELDFAILDGKIYASDLCSLMMDTDRLMLIVAPEHPLANHKSVTIDELRQENLILRPDGSGTRELFTASLQSRNMSIDEFRVILEVDNIATIKDLIRHGYGVSILAESACMDELRKGKIVALPIERLSMERQMNIVYARDFGHTDLLNEIVELYKEM